MQGYGSFPIFDEFNKASCTVYVPSVWKSQIATLNEGRGHNIKKLPYAFTENGVAMLSSVLRS